MIGEAYCDHPSFGHAIVSRLFVSLGYTVAMLPQPQCDGDYMRFGAPRLGFLVTGGVVDSMVNNYTVAKIRRKRDVYSEGGDVGKRPDRCVDVYCRALKRLFPDVPVVIGGIEASLRRFAHYDYWSDRVLPSVLASSGADLLIYGMGERPIKDICALLDRGVPLGRIRDVRGTCYIADSLTERQTKAIERGDMLVCPSLEEVRGDKRKYVDAFNIQSRNADFAGKPIAQRQGERWLVQNAPQRPLSVKEMDEVYALPYERRAHPVYKRGVPAMEEIGFSLTSVRGCFGSCNYCALTYHQGRIVQKRSRESIVEEAKKLIAMPDFKGYIHDVGGPTANFRDPACAKQTKVGACTDRQCIGWKKCPALQVSHREYLDLLRELRELDGVKKVFVRSGIRFDYVMYDKSDEFLRELVKHHVSGQLKVAPEHVSDDVLKRMNKPPFEVYLQFKKRYDELNAKLGKKQYLVPYLISSHPGCTLADAVRLAEYLHSIGVYVPRDRHEKAMQRALMQYRAPRNYELVKQALRLAGREDLIGFGRQCLIRPTRAEAIAAKHNADGAGHGAKNRSNGKRQRRGR